MDTLTANTARDQVREALLHLDAQCDGAQQQDTVGFNGTDAYFGKSLARQVREGRSLSYKQLVAALKMMRKYEHTQLQSAGIALPIDGAIKDEADEFDRAVTGVTTATPTVAKPSNGSTNRIELRDDGNLSVYFKYVPEWVEQIKTLPSGHRNYSPFPRPHWTVSGPLLPRLRALFPAFVVDPKILERERQIEAERIAKENERLERAIKLRAAIDLDAPFYNDERKELHLMQHQKDGVQFAIQRAKGVIIADEMGLGKTIMSLFVAKAYQKVFGCYVFVVCDVSLKVNPWAREARWVGVNIETFSWAKIPDPLLFDKPYVVIFDECARMQNMRAARTKRALALSQKAMAVYPMSGTPMRNAQPSNLFPSLLAVEHHLAEDRKAYEVHFCKAQSTAYNPWDTSGAAHLKELYQLMQDVMLRRKKKDCLDLPEFERILRRAEVDAVAMKVYKTKLAAMRASYAERLRQGIIKEGGEVLVEIGQLRLAGSMAKVNSAYEAATEVMEQEEQVVLFTAFKETAHEIMRRMQHDGFTCDLLSGDTPTADRAPMVDRFQNHQTQAMVCMFGAGGVGITLHAAQTVILIDRDWTPDAFSQAESRIHRTGQRNACTSVWFQAFEVDERLDALLIAKQRRIDKALDGKVSTLRGLESMQEVALELYRELMESDDEEIETEEPDDKEDDNATN